MPNEKGLKRRALVAVNLWEALRFRISKGQETRIMTRDLLPASYLGNAAKMSAGKLQMVILFPISKGPMR